MTRRRTEAQPPALRNEILGAAQRFVASKGFEQMTIEDILGQLRISKGAFYHYFESKGVLLEALIARMGDEGKAMLLPILQDPGLTAVDKLQHWFAAAAQWKSTRKDMLISLIRSWYHDDNAIVRAKLRSTTWTWLGPLLGSVIRQGIEEGAFSTAYPEHAGQVVYSLLYDLGDCLAEGLLRNSPDDRAFTEAQKLTAAFTDAVERALGSEPGRLRLIDPDMLQAWYSASTPVP